MKKSLSLLLCLAFFGSLQAQHLWNPIHCEASWLGDAPNPFFLGASSNGDLFARAGTTAPYLLRSHDDGAQWESLSDFDVCTFMAFSPQGRIFFFPAEFADVYYSDDNCLSWYNTSNHSVENYQMSGACAVSNDTLLMWGANQLDYTLDGGLTWLTTHPAVVGNDQIISDMLVNQNGDVYISVYHHFLPDGIGVYHATLSDMQNWELVAFEGLGIMDMEFDPEGNVLCGVYFGGEFSGFEHIPGFYAFNARNFGVADNGIIYKMDNTTDNTVVLAYSHDHGQTFTDHGEGLPLPTPAPGGYDGTLMKGCDNHLFFQANAQCWKSIPNANDIPYFNPWIGEKFYDEASTLYYNIISDTTVEVTYDELYENTGYNSYQGDIVIPETVTYGGITYTVTAVGNRAFNSCHGTLTSVVVPGTVTSIGELAFAGSWQLRIVVLPNSVTFIGNRVFCDCQQLTSVRLPEGISIIPTGMFINCTSLSSFVIPPTVTRVEEDAFGGSAVASVVIPNSVTHIGDNAFSSCSNLSSVDIPNSVTELGSGVFSYCRELRSIHLPENLVVIPSLLLNGCEDLTSITIPETVTSIETCAFLNCYGLTVIELPLAVTALGESAFQSCRNLESIVIPETVHDFGNNVFLGCQKLKTLSLPQGIDAIPSGMFWGCTLLDSITIPESVVTINGWAFSDCANLREIIVPNNVVSIGYGAFLGCDKLSKVELGASVSDLANDVFRKTNSGSAKLTLVCHNPVPASCGLTTFPDPMYQDTVITPCGFLETYREAWGEYWQTSNFKEDCEFVGSEWYYEIINEDGTITYQHLEYVADTTINHKDVKIIIRNNTLYDKSRNNVHNEYNVITREYLYEENNVVYWWNPTLEDFTILYDFGASQGDEWEIQVGENALTMHVDAVEHYEYEGTLFKMLKVSDSQALFSGTIVCGIGHLTSFFPERLMNPNKSYRVEGIRCFWQDGNLVFKYGDRDCDEIYEQYHSSLPEITIPHSAFRIPYFTLSPNPTDGLVIVEMYSETSQPGEFRVTNLTGQTLLTGSLTGEKQIIDLSGLPKGVYFLTINNRTQKLIIQ